MQPLPKKVPSRPLQAQQTESQGTHRMFGLSPAATPSSSCRSPTASASPVACRARKFGA